MPRKNLTNDKRCAVCGSPDKLHVHHIDGQTKRWGFENNNPANLLVLCVECHAANHSKTRGFTKKLSARGNWNARIYSRRERVSPWKRQRYLET